jgi:hypothetical protein
MHGVKGYSTFWEAMRLRYYEYIPGVNQPEEEKDIGDGHIDWIKKSWPWVCEPWPMAASCI